MTTNAADVLAEALDAHMADFVARPDSFDARQQVAASLARQLAARHITLVDEGKLARARDLIANYLWNEDGEAEIWLVEAHDILRAALDSGSKP